MALKSITDIEEQSRNEENTKLNYITPAIQKKWNNEGDKIVMEYNKDGTTGHYFTDGQIHVDAEGNVSRGKRKKVDYLLLFKHNIPLALVEAKGYDHDVMEGVQQALEYAALLDVPYAYASNGQVFHEEDRKTGANREFGMDDFPTSDELWERYMTDNGISEEEMDLLISPYYVSSDGKKPRYYQRNAINRCIEAIAKGQNRLLLVMATGTGKTFVAMQIIYRLYTKGIKKKILFLVDRTALAEQTFDAFTPFKKSMVRIGEKYTLKNEEDIKKLSAYEVFISLYHQMKAGKSDAEEDECYVWDDSSEDKDYYKNLPADFFDLIVVDECHRGSLREESGWHEMLDYFKSATQIGLTATPKETAFGSNISYFCQENDGKPIYTYSLQQGIKDGFLAPYKVMTYEFDVDRDGYMPKKGEKDIFGKPLEQRVYEQREFDRKLIIDERRQLVARQISEYLKATDRFTKTIVFCETEEHAGAMMNYLKNENKDLVAQDSRYVMRITANDQAGKDQIKNFSAPSQRYPVIAVTSKLLSTGVDTQTVGLIVLDKTIGSMSEFKQTIGRGTRIKESYKIDDVEYSKTHFVIMDFRKNYLKFNDPDFDGDVEVVDGTRVMPCPVGGKKAKSKREIFRVKNVNIEIVDRNVKYLDEDMNLVKEENLESCVRNNVLDHYPDYEAFKNAWSSADDKVVLAMELLMHERFIEEIRAEFGFNVDLFDIIGFVAYGKAIPTKADRISRTADYVITLTTEQQKVVSLLLECYKQSDFNDLRLLKIFDLPIFAQNGFTRKNAVSVFGGKDNYLKVVDDLEKIMY